MPMDELSSSEQKVSSGVLIQEDTHIVYPNRDGYAFCVERGTSASETQHGCDLERGIVVSEPEASSLLASARSLFGKVWGSLGLTQRVDKSIGGHTMKSSVQCGVPCGCRQKEAKVVFTESVVSGFQKQTSQDLGLAKAGNRVSGEKIRHGNANTSLKPGWQKPPRPPRASSDASRGRHMNGISDNALQRKARLERMRSFRKQKPVKPYSTKTAFWALMFTALFLSIMIIQGIFSQGIISTTKSDQASSLLKHKFSSYTLNSASGHTKTDKWGIRPLGKLSAPSFS